MKVDKVLNTSDFLPTVLNLLGVESPYSYIGHDAFDSLYTGFVPFSDGSWISGKMAYDAASGEWISVDGNRRIVSDLFQSYLDEKVHSFIQINNLLLETDYYAAK